MNIQPTVITEINILHDELEASLRTAIAKAIRIGELLSNCKSNLPHGQFGEWVVQNTRFSLRTAQNYMKLFHNREKLSAGVTITEAYRLLKSETVSFLDLLKNHLQDIINEDLPALDAFDHQEVIDRLPTSEDAKSLKLLEEGERILHECVLRERRKIGQLVDELEMIKK